MEAPPYNPAAIAARYLKFYWQAENSQGHGVHSPFVFDFIQNVLNNRKAYQPPAALESERILLQNNFEEIQIMDLGAGSRKGDKGLNTVSALAKNSLKPQKLAEMLHRLVRHYQPANILELGTSLGLTSAYLATGNPRARMTTIEGNPAIAAQAKSLLEKLGLHQIECLEGNFDEVLTTALEGMGRVDLAYLDGNHRHDPTVAYFEQLLPYCTDKSILIFDDIYWSPGMEKAWHYIINHESVRYTLDIFHMGFVFFNPEFRVPARFKLRFR